ncbi:MAG: excinuclease ABC subunit A [Rubricella sp.]
MGRRLAALAFIAFAAPAFAPMQGLANGPRHCPPGLADRTPACVPPGLARLDRGDRVPHDRYDIIRQWRDFGLERPAEEEIYIRIDGESGIYRVIRDTLIVLEAIDTLDRRLN